MISEKSSSKTRTKRSGEIREDNPAGKMESVFLESSDCQRSKKYHSDVRNYFSKNVSRKKVLCQLCNNQYSYLRTTSNLRDPLIPCHKDKYTRNDTIESGNKQQTSMDTFLNYHKCPPTHAKKITTLVVFMVAKDLRLVAIADGEDFYPSWYLGI